MATKTAGSMYPVLRFGDPGSRTMRLFEVAQAAGMEQTITAPRYVGARLDVCCSEVPSRVLLSGQLELLVCFSPLERSVELDRVLVQWDLGIKDLSDAEGRPVFVSPAKLMSASLGIRTPFIWERSKVKLWWNQNRSFGRNRAFGGKHHLITAQWLDLGVWCNGCCSTREWKVLRGRGLRGRLVGY